MLLTVNLLLTNTTEKPQPNKLFLGLINHPSPSSLTLLALLELVLLSLQKIIKLIYG